MASSFSRMSALVEDNDVLFGVGSGRLKQSDLLPPHVVMATKSLQKSVVSKDFSRTGWRATGAHFTECVGRRPSFVADGSLFSRVPDRLLRYLCSGVGIAFSDRMIDGWEKPFLNVQRLYNPDLDDTADFGGQLP